MKRIPIVLFLFVAVVIVGIIGAGFYRGWFSFTSDSADQKSNVTFSVDTDKFQADKKTAVASAQELGRQIKDQVARPSKNWLDGTVIGVASDKLTMTNKEGKEQSHALAADTKVTCDGKECKAADLKAGMRIRVTTNEAAPHAASRIEALDKDAAFASNSHDGKVVSITGGQLVMTNLEGNDERTCTLTGDAKVTCDGKLCKASDLKPGMKIRVTTTEEEPLSAIHIEALDKNRDFARVG